MDDHQRYLFDLQGYIHLPGLLQAAQAAELLESCQQLERDAMACSATAPRSRSVWGIEYWQNPEHGYFASGSQGHGQTLMAEDFWLYSPSFDFLIGHEPTMQCVRRVVRGDIGINNSELRIRYPGNLTGMHMGFPQGHSPKYRYSVVEGQISCMMVRMIYFLHDVDADQGVTCFVPGSHHGSFPVPGTGMPVEEEPGVVGIPVKAGDAIFFSENCRHGGFPNRRPQTRYTLHVGYGPAFMPSQNISTMDEEANVTEGLMSRLTEEQRKLLRRPRHSPLPGD